MRLAFALPLCLLTAACTTDIVRHDAGGQLGDGGSGVDSGLALDAGGPTDATVKPDAGPTDATPQDMGGGPRCSITSTPVSFEPTQVGRTSDSSLVLMNVGFDVCRVTARIDPPGAGFNLGNTVLADLGPGETELVTLQFSPTAPGDAQAALLVEVNQDPSTVEAVAELRGQAFLAEVAATTQVTYRVRNASGADRYLVLQGRDCTGFALNVPTQLSFQCGCECPPPPPPGPLQLLRIAPGATETITWDARRLYTWDITLECGPGHTETEVQGALAPVPNGSYPTRIAFERSVPAFCNPSGTAGLYDCDPTSDTGPQLPNPISPLCDTDGFVQVTAIVDVTNTQVSVDITN